MSAGAPTRCRVSPEQLHVLLSFMEEHRDFAAGKQSVYSRFSACKLWRLLAERLNGAADESGGAHKSPDKWCRYWADIKYRARKKWAAGESLGDLSSVEERLQSILGTRTSD
ncbi:jg6481, partial [Pararge aegeria aegeria]